MFRILPGVMAAFALAMVSLAAAPAAKAQIEVEKEVDRTSVPLVQAGPARGVAAKTCRKVKYAFVCRDGNKGSGKAACRRGESEASCCARIKSMVAQACRRHGGLAKFKCACSHPGGAPGGLLAPGEQGSGKSGHKGGNVEFEWKVEEGESAPPAKPGIRSPGTPILKRTVCDEVSFAYRCKRRDPQKSGRRACARNQTEAECCDAAHSRVMRECGGVPAQWRCRCTN